MRAIHEWAADLAAVDLRVLLSDLYADRTAATIVEAETPSEAALAPSAVGPA
jgi:hypothetical protein